MVNGDDGSDCYRNASGVDKDSEIMSSKPDGMDAVINDEGHVASSAPSPSLNQSRPTRQEAMELSIIISTPPYSDVLTPIRQSPAQRRYSHQTNRQSHSISPLLSQEVTQSYEQVCLPSFPKIKVGPPYESSLLPLQKTHIQKKFSLRPRSSLVFQRKSPDQMQPNFLLVNIHDGLGPFLSALPESIIFSIVNFIDYRERHPKLFLISHGMTNILTRPEFLLEAKHNFNEFLFVVGGKYPSKAIDINDDNNVENGEERLPRRMPFRRNNLGIMGYDTKNQVWMRFGGDPIQNHFPVAARTGMHINSLHPLSPFGIVDSKSLYVGHPHYILMFFGGIHHETGMPSNRVVAYSFLTAQWKTFPDMLRARRGEDFVVASVSNDNTVTGNDSIVLVGCDLEFCDCLRCDPPTPSNRPNVSIDMISFADNQCDEISTKLRTRRDNLHSIRKCEILDLNTRKWRQSQSRAPFCPPDDGGVAVVQGRYIYLPGTCPPPPTSTAWDATGEIVTPISQSEANSLSQSPSSSIGEIHAEYDHLSATSMDIEERDCLDVESSPLESIYRSLHYRPGLVYDSFTDSWRTLPARQFVTTSSPTTCTFEDHVLVLGGYRSSSENALSCYRHREEEAILDYEDHLDYSWYYSKPRRDLGDNDTFEDDGTWKFGGGTTMFGHRQAWAHSSDLASAVAAAQAIGETKSHCNQMPNRAPVPVRGASATTFQGRLTVLGGLSTFSRTFYDIERKIIWQYFQETREWHRASMQLPVPALLNGYTFSMHI